MRIAASGTSELRSNDDMVGLVSSGPYELGRGEGDASKYSRDESTELICSETAELAVGREERRLELGGELSAGLGSGSLTLVAFMALSFAICSVL